MRAFIGILIMVLGFALPVFVAKGQAQTLQEAKVTYVSGNTLYFDAGSEQGVAAGDTVELLQDGAVTGKVKVIMVTETRASAEVDATVTSVNVGDLVRYAPAPPAKSAEPFLDKVKSLNALGIRGRVGARVLYLKDNSDRGGYLFQPGIDLRLSGTQVADKPFDFEIDMRPRRTYRTLGDGPSTEKESNRVYRLNGTWRTGPYRLVLGRQVSSSVAPLSLFDGALLEYHATGGYTVGGFYGTEPDPRTWGVSADVRDLGVFAETGSEPDAEINWTAGAGAVSSTEKGEVNRDFLYLSGRASYKNLFGIFTQEIDINRGWRRDEEDSTFTISGSYALLRWQATESWSLSGGVDSRRSVRVYRDYVTPVTEFDDDYRQGYWAGVQWFKGNHWLVGADTRLSRGGSAGSADAYSVNLGALNLTSRALDLRVRGTRYTGPFLDGNLGSVTVSGDLTSTIRLEAHGGLRLEKEKKFHDEDRNVNWIGAGADFLLTRRLWASVTYDRTTGEDEDNDQVFASVSVRF